ncbi:hypothetical protein A3SI_04092 [Nitritalea halalkaliphila LW7]|uniref:Transmembrane protein n=1 Tax=Nitritalea halalkaliphila LW7 TaxID=1189621 RepID=I5C901_9BACT|nr:hypothetical protein [Nitritalea halalkaliphila]EIM78303.1 hypothetical protein A3SI_04092 [Nitritalea halalkaliphila LW7]
MEDLENAVLRKRFEATEKVVMALIAVPLVPFIIVYLYVSSDVVEVPVPELSLWLRDALLWGSIGLIAVHYVRFHRAIKPAKERVHMPIEEKMERYADASVQRFVTLFISGLLLTAGLFFFQDPMFTLGFAAVIIFMSLGKPTADRIVRLLRLKGEERKMVEQLRKRIG